MSLCGGKKIAVACWATSGKSLLPLVSGPICPAWADPGPSSAALSALTFFHQRGGPWNLPEVIQVLGLNRDPHLPRFPLCPG